MDMSEYFTQTEQSILCLLDKIQNKNEWTAVDCSKGLESLRALKTWQKKRNGESHMEQNFNVLIQRFHETAENSKQYLQAALVKISEGNVPGKSEMEQMNQSVNQLRQKYADIYQLASEVLSTEEIPPEGSSVNDYANAVQHSQTLARQRELVSLQNILNQFVSVQSLVKVYAEALAPYQKKARELMDGLSNISLEDENAFRSISDSEEIHGSKTFLEALACTDYNTDEWLDKLSNVQNFYPLSVYTGLATKSYQLSAPSAPKDEGSNATPMTNESTENSLGLENAKTTLTNIAASDEAIPADEEVWRKLGVASPDQIILSISKEHFEIKRDAKAATPFSTKRFENDLRRIGTRNSCAYVLKNVRSIGCVSVEILDAQNPSDFFWSDICEKLLKTGYFQKYILNSFEPIYSLTSKGKNIFTTQKSAQLLGLKKEPLEETEIIEDTVSATLTRILMLHTPLIKIWIGNKKKSKLIEPYLRGNFFFNTVIYEGLPAHSCIFTGIVSTSVKDFKDYTQTMSSVEFLKPSKRQTAAFIVVGLNHDQARSLANFVFSRTSDKIQSAVCGYYDYSTKTCYRYDDDSILALAPLASDQDEADNFEDSENKEDLGEKSNQEISTELVKPDVSALDQNKADTSPAELDVTADVNDAAENANPPQESENIDIPEKKEKTMQPFGTEQLKETSVDKVNADPQQQNHIDVWLQMLESGQMYCATAYIRALANQYPIYRPLYEKLAYALNDPAYNCTYQSENVYRAYFSVECIIPVPDHFVLSAVLRNVFYGCHGDYDYMLPMLQSAIQSNPVLERIPSLKNILYTLTEFKRNYPNGLDYYADYRQKARQRFDSHLKKNRQEAQEFYNNYVKGDIKERTPMKRFIEAKKLAFSPSGSLGEGLKIVVDGKNDPELNRIIAEELRETYIKDKETICRTNVDPQKISVAVDDFWKKAEEQVELKKKTAPLMGGLRTNFGNQIRKAVEILAEYIQLTTDFSPQEDDIGFISYQKVKTTLLQNLHEAADSCEQEEDQAGSNVLKITLEELQARINGSYSEERQKDFYMEFLRDDKVLLDPDSCLPDLEEVQFVDGFSAAERIAAHSKHSLLSYEDRLKQIFDGEDDYGSAQLILEFLSRTVSAKDFSGYEIQESLKYAGKMLELKRKEFIENLELEQSYGQISDDSRKEVYLDVVSYWYDKVSKTKNFGFFYKILQAIQEHIKLDAHSREDELRRNMDSYLSENQNWSSSEEISSAVHRFEERIKNQNYAAAEDQLNRLIFNDLSFGTEVQQEDYLQNFIKENDTNYKLTADSSKTLQHLIFERFQRIRNKETKGGARILSAWPKSAQSVTESSVAELMRAFGFKVAKSIELSFSEKMETKEKLFEIVLKRPANGRKSNYAHPIYIFGSEAEQVGFWVICLFGKFTSKQLMDKIANLGNTQNTLILLDYALPMPERRELARITKKNFTGKTYVVIDRVVAAFLANHYSETAINRMLMAIVMPYSAHQPYIEDSASVMPPEIFMGRRDELEKIEDVRGANIVYGGRQLGKSALLRMAKNDIDGNENHDRAVLVDIKNCDYKAAARKVSEALVDEQILTPDSITESWETLARSIKNRLRSSQKDTPIHYLLLLMDEADIFLESCEKINYAPFDALKDIQSIGTNRFKFVVAGLRNVVRFKRNIALANNSVLTHLSSITIMPFKSYEARELLEIPLWYLGFRFKDDTQTEALISTIFGTTNYFPGLLQLYCSKLIEALQHNYAGYAESKTPPYEVNESLIKKTLSDEMLLQQIREKFFITLKVDQDDYYYLIALLGAFHYHNFKERSGFSAQDILTLASEYGIGKLASMSKQAVQALMEEMRELNILQSVTNGVYRFARHSFCQMMGSMEEIDSQIEEVMSDNEV